MKDKSSVDSGKRAFLAGTAVIGATLASQKTNAFWGASSVESCEVLSESAAVDEVISTLKKLEHIHHGFPITQLDHALQTATLARKAGESDQVVVASLCHDMAKAISAFNHEVMAAEMLRPYLNDKTYNMMKYHGIFQGRFFWHRIGRDHETYKKFQGEPWYDLTMKFTEVYDKPAFKRENVQRDSLESFLPTLRKVING